MRDLNRLHGRPPSRTRPSIRVAALRKRAAVTERVTIAPTDYFGPAVPAAMKLAHLVDE